MTVNLLKETLEILEECKKSPRDVKWVGSKDGKYAITWNEFEKIGSFLYNPYNPINIAYDLVVVGEEVFYFIRQSLVVVSKSTIL